MVPVPEHAPLSETYWSALGAGQLRFQRCSACGHAWLPPRSECPACLGADWSWEQASGRGKLVTWTVYHIAYDEAFAGRLPYNVAIVELVEGPRLVTNIVNPAAHGGMVCDRPVELTIDQEDGVALARFRLVDRMSG